MYNNPYMPNYYTNFNQQNMNDRIDGQIAQLQQMKEQIKNNPIQQPNQQPAINQTFQLAPNGNGGIRYVDSIDEVSKQTVFMDTPFFSKDLSILWIKDSSGGIRAYELNEIVKKDEKDMQIELLIARVNELEGMINNEQSNANVISTKISTDTTTIDEPIREPIKEDKPTSISRVSTSKKK